MRGWWYKVFSNAKPLVRAISGVFASLVGKSNTVMPNNARTPALSTALAVAAGKKYLWCVMCDVWCVMCDVWCVMCDMCDVWCVMCDMCDVWCVRCVMCDVWCVICDVWCVWCVCNYMSLKQVVPPRIISAIACSAACSTNSATTNLAHTYTNTHTHERAIQRESVWVCERVSVESVREREREVYSAHVCAVESLYITQRYIILSFSRPNMISKPRKQRYIVCYAS